MSQGRTGRPQLRTGSPGAGSNSPRQVNLALQGGGAHGAFTWGVIDMLLEDGRIAIDGISGTSAGAMNAAVLAGGIAAGGPDEARRRLERFWRAVSIDGQLLPAQRAILDAFLGAWRLGASHSWFGVPAPVLSPYESNPLDINPLRDVVLDHVDFKDVRACQELKLFIAATNVYTGKVRVFRKEEVDADVLMASACLPYLFRAVEIGGTPYWDGGYMGNPVLFPFFTETDTADILLVQINPIERHELPDTAREIGERVNEITFNASLLHELRAIDFVRRLIDQGRLEGTHYKRIRLHRIEAQKELARFGASSKLSADWSFFRELHAIGRAAARRFLDRHFEMIGVEGTVDIAQELA
jgi:NTE family protein